MTNCAREKSAGLDGLPFGFYLHRLDLFGDLLMDVYHDWLQNERIASAVSRDMVVLRRKELERPIALLNTDYKVLAIVLAKKLAIVVGELIGNAKTWAIPNRTITSNLHPTHYIIKRVGKELGIYGALIYLDHSKAFDKVYRRYFDTILAAGFGPIFRVWIDLMYIVIFVRRPK